MKSTLIVRLAMVALLALGSVSFAQDESAPPAADAPTADAVQLSVDSQESVSDAAVVETTVTPVADGAVYSTPAVTSDCIGCGSVATPGFGTPMVMSPMVMSQGVMSQGVMPSTVGCGGCSSCGGCSTCGTGCGAVQTASYVPTSSCGSCGVGQVTYEQPLYQSVQATTSPAMPMQTAIVNPAPQPVSVVAAPMTTTYAAPMTSGCSTCGNAAPVMNYSTPATNYPAPMVSNYAAPVANSGCSTCGTSGAVTTNYAPVSSGYVSTGCTNCPQRGGMLRGRVFNRR